MSIDKMKQVKKQVKKPVNDITRCDWISKKFAKELTKEIREYDVKERGEINKKLEQKVGKLTQREKIILKLLKDEKLMQKGKNNIVMLPINEKLTKQEKRIIIHYYLKKLSDTKKNALKQLKENLSEQLEQLKENDLEQYNKYNLEELYNFPNNKTKHVIRGSKNSKEGHLWKKLAPNENWEDIKEIIAHVLVNGEQAPYKKVNKKRAKVYGYDVEVTYIIQGDKIRVSDAWVKKS